MKTETIKEIANLKEDLFAKMPASQGLKIIAKIAKDWSLKPMANNRDWMICKKIVLNSIVNN